MLLKLENVLSAEEIAKARIAAKSAEFLDGTTSGRKALKNNLQTRQTSPDVAPARAIVVNALMRRTEFTSFAIPKKLTCMFNLYKPGMFYRDHIDAALMGPSQDQAIRSDLSFTVFLTKPSEYEGGEFILTTPYGAQSIKETPGTVIVYPSLMLHRVEPISKGERLSCVGWIQSFVRDPAQRDVLQKLDHVRRTLAADMPDSDHVESAAQVYQNLMRMWAEV